MSMGSFPQIDEPRNLASGDRPIRSTQERRQGNAERRDLLRAVQESLVLEVTES